MAEVVVVHHTLGLTGPVRRFAGELRAAGHTVHTPDLYDGRTFETYEDGASSSETLGGPLAAVERARAEVSPVRHVLPTAAAAIRCYCEREDAMEDGLVVIGVDAHERTHMVATDAVGRRLAQTTVEATSDGTWARSSGRRWPGRKWPSRTAGT